MSHWAKELVGKVVIHAPTGAFGRVVRFFSGEEGDRFKAPESERAVPAPIVQLDNGHSFVVPLTDPKRFLVLSDAEAGTFLSLVETFGQTNIELAKYAASRGVPPEKFLTMMAAILQSQLRALAVKPKVEKAG